MCHTRKGRKRKLSYNHSVILSSNLQIVFPPACYNDMSASRQGAKLISFFEYYIIPALNCTLKVDSEGSEDSETECQQ